MTNWADLRTAIERANTKRALRHAMRAAMLALLERVDRDDWEAQECIGCNRIRRERGADSIPTDCQECATLQRVAADVLSGGDDAENNYGDGTGGMEGTSASGVAACHECGGDIVEVYRLHYPKPHCRECMPYMPPFIDDVGSTSARGVEPYKFCRVTESDRRFHGDDYRCPCVPCRAVWTRDDAYEAAQAELAEALKRIDVLDNALTLETERANDYRDAVEGAQVEAEVAQLRATVARVEALRDKLREHHADDDWLIGLAEQVTAALEDA